MSDTITTSVAKATASSTSTTTTTPASSGRPASSYGAAPHDPSKPPVKRQIVAFSFYKVMPEWRRLPAEEKAAHLTALAAINPADLPHVTIGKNNVATSRKVNSAVVVESTIEI